MPEEKSKPERVFIQDGYQPTSASRGYQPADSKPSPQGGHQPETGQNTPRPPSGGSSES